MHDPLLSTTDLRCRAEIGLDRARASGFTHTARALEDILAGLDGDLHPFRAVCAASKGVRGR